MTPAILLKNKGNNGASDRPIIPAGAQLPRKKGLNQ